MPRPSTGASLGDVEMRDVEPNLDLSSVYGSRSSEFDGENAAAMPSEGALALLKAPAARQPGEKSMPAAGVKPDGPAAALAATSTDRNLTIGGEDG